MQIDIKIDQSCPEPKITITTNEMTDEISNIIKMLSENISHTLVGFKDGTATLLEYSDIFRIFSSNNRVIADTASGEYQLRMRLYEIESRLEAMGFIRISHSEIVNIKKVKSFDLSITGTILISMSNGSVSYASRRYIGKIKQLLGI